MIPTTQLIKRHINRLAAGELFTTRELLAYGDRPNVDSATSRLVAREKIRRVARGVFMKPGYSERRPSALEILQAKMRAWGKNFWHDTDHQQPPASDNAQQPERLIVHVSGSTSSFKTYTGTEVILRHSGPRRMKLSASPAGQLARRLWNQGQDQLKNWHLEFEYVRLGREAVTEFLRFYKLVPAWLNDTLHKRRFRHFGKDIWDIGTLGQQV